MAQREYNTTDDIRDYYLYNIEQYGVEAPRTMGYHQGPIDDRLIAPLLPTTLPSQYSVLDVGCGLGQLIPILASRFTQVTLTRFVGIDLVEDFVTRCRERFPEHEFHSGNFLEWHSTESFDLVLAAGVLVTKIANYKEYIASMVAKMVRASNAHIGFNLVGNQSASYTAKHLATISHEDLANILQRFPSVQWTVANIEVFPGANDLFVVGKVSKRSSPQ